MLFTEGTTTSTTVDRVYVENGSLVYGEYTKALEANTWYTLSVVFDYENGRAYYYINDEYAPVGVSSYKIKENDVYTFKLEKFE